MRWLVAPLLLLLLTLPAVAEDEEKPGESPGASTGEMIGPHRMAALKHANSLNVELLVLYRKGKYAEAVAIAREALAIYEEVLGPEHLSTATSLNNLASLLETFGAYDEAQSLYERALAIFERVLGPEHERTATSLNNLAGLLKMLGAYDTAR